MNRDIDILIRSIEELSLKQHVTELVGICITRASQLMVYQNIPIFITRLTSMSLSDVNALINLVQSHLNGEIEIPAQVSSPQISLQQSHVMQPRSLPHLISVPIQSSQPTQPLKVIQTTDVPVAEPSTPASSIPDIPSDSNEISTHSSLIAPSETSNKSKKIRRTFNVQLDKQQCMISNPTTNKICTLPIISRYDECVQINYGNNPDEPLLITRISPPQYPSTNYYIEFNENDKDIVTNKHSFGAYGCGV